MNDNLGKLFNSERKKIERTSKNLSSLVAKSDKLRTELKTASGKAKDRIETKLGKVNGDIKLLESRFERESTSLRNSLSVVKEANEALPKSGNRKPKSPFRLESNNKRA